MKLDRIVSWRVWGVGGGGGWVNEWKFLIGRCGLRCKVEGRFREERRERLKGREGFEGFGGGKRLNRSDFFPIEVFAANLS